MAMETIEQFLVNKYHDYVFRSASRSSFEILDSLTYGKWVSEKLDKVSAISKDVAMFTESLNKLGEGHSNDINFIHNLRKTKRDIISAVNCIDAVASHEKNLKKVSKKLAYHAITVADELRMKMSLLENTALRFAPFSPEDLAQITAFREEANEKIDTINNLLIDAHKAFKKKKDVKLVCRIDDDPVDTVYNEALSRETANAAKAELLVNILDTIAGASVTVCNIFEHNRVMMEKYKKNDEVAKVMTTIATDNPSGSDEVQLEMISHHIKSEFVITYNRRSAAVDVIRKTIGEQFVGDPDYTILEFKEVKATTPFKLN